MCSTTRISTVIFSDSSFRPSCDCTASTIVGPASLSLGRRPQSITHLKAKSYLPFRPVASTTGRPKVLDNTQRGAPWIGQRKAAPHGPRPLRIGFAGDRPVG